MKHCRFIAILIVVFFAENCSVLALNVDNTQQKPNIIFIITDDQGMGDLGFTGNPYIQTPHIDQFANDAVRFTNFHVGTTCAPSRSALMSGRHCNRVNVYHTIVGRSILFEDEVILPQVLAQNGYINGMYGKWHLGDNYPYRPEDRGFHEVVRHAAGGVGQGPDYWMNDYFDDTYWHNGEHQKYEGYCTDVFFSEALKFIEKNKDKPFFCYLSTNAPHSPFNLPDEYYDMYQGEKFEDLPHQVRRFYGMITNIDDNFKKLKYKLDELGLTDNTILVFTTDNGTAAGRQTYNAGLRGGKGSQYDGGHRVPFFIRWPNGALTGGKDIGKLVANYDLLPTFVDLLGLDFNPVKPLDGESLTPLLYHAEANWENRILYIDTQRKQNLVKYKAYSVMDEEWRLVDGDELYNITNDRAQENNVIDEHPEVAARLAEGYEKWWQSFMDDNVDEKYAYIKVGSPYENPSKISAHDLIVGKYSPVWHQRGAIQGVQSGGSWKIEFVEDGEYSISLRRFPRESGLAINATFPAQEERTELDRTLPASVKSDFTEAYLFVANVSERIEIEEGQEEVTFKANIPAGKYDMEAQLIDEANRVHPAYYVYIEKQHENATSQDVTWEKDELLFEDPGTGNWKEKWMLDGQRSKVINTGQGMELIAGPEHGNDTCHTVLWTKQSFEGNVCIEYDYTRTDTTTRCVNILYFHATGKGEAGYPADISLWNDKRIVPHMSTYYNNMHAYHISYAAFAARKYSGENDYIRLRRYNPDKKGLKGTDVPPDHFKTGLFQPGQTYHIQVFRFNDQIEMHIQNKQDSAEKLVCKWDVSTFPPCNSGRIGLRHMYTRSARYKNFKVWEISQVI